MKNKLNNKGFAVSTVVYAILILLVIFMFTILLLYRNSYRNQKDFNDEVKEELNDYLIDEFTPPDLTAPSCTLEAKDNLDGSYTLTIKSKNTDLDLNGPYMFEGGSYSNNNTTIKTKSDCSTGTCTYKAFVRDMAGNVSNACTKKVEFDVIAPTCSLTATGSGTSRTLTITSNDTDIANSGYSFDGTSFSSTKTKTVTTSGTYYGYVKDRSGNVSGACSVNVQLDNLGPSISLSVTGGKNTATIKATITDSGTGVKQYQITTSSSTPTSGWTTLTTPQASVSVDYIKTSATSYYVHAKDEAGNANYSSKKLSFSRSSSCSCEKYEEKWVPETCKNGSCIEYDSCAKCDCSSYGSYVKTGSYSSSTNDSSSSSNAYGKYKTECDKTTNASGLTGYYCVEYTAYCQAYNSCSSCSCLEYDEICTGGYWTETSTCETRSACWLS